MIGIDRLSVAKRFVKLLNLVAFDVCDLNDIEISQPADPLSFIIKCSLKEPIAKELHAPLRKGIKSDALRLNLLVGKIVLQRRLEIVVYQKSLRGAAYIHGESPQDSDS